MRLLCLFFPRLAIQLARRRDPGLAFRPLVTLFGDGDAALVSDASTEASNAGVAIGMLASVARGRCPAASFLPDNAGECLDVLERAAAILRLRATPTVAIAGRDHLFIDLAGTESRFASEAEAAARLASIVRGWTGCEVRAGVASSRPAALAAARQARRFATVAPPADVIEPPLPPLHDDALRAAFRWDAAPGPVAARARLVRMLTTLQSVLEARDQSFRDVALELGHDSGAAATVRFRSPAPLHRAVDALQLLGGRLPDEVLAGVTTLTVVFERLGPAVRIQPLRRECRTAPVLAAPVRPLQHRLLRAG